MKSTDEGLNEPKPGSAAARQHRSIPEQQTQFTAGVIRQSNVTRPAKPNTTNTITTSLRSSVGSSNVARPSKAKTTTNTGRLRVNRHIESLSASERFSFTAKAIHAIAQQAGQRERRLARFLSSMSLAAAALPWTLADQPQNHKSTARSKRYHYPT